jgi:LysM repeat protein
MDTAREDRPATVAAVVSSRDAPDHPVFGGNRPYFQGRGADSYLRTRRSNRRKMVLAALGVLVVLAAVGGAGYWLGRRSVENDPTTAVEANDDTTTTAAGASPSTTGAPASSGVQPTTARPEEYIVQAGDSLDKIARQFGTTIAALVALNGIANPDRLIEGTRLKIPPPTAPTTAVPAPPTT